MPQKQKQNPCHLTITGEEKATLGKQPCLPWKYYVFGLLEEKKN